MMKNVNESRDNRKLSLKLKQTKEEIQSNHQKIDSELSLNRSLITEELYMSQLGLDTFPISMGDTIFLQLSHMKKLACMRNNFTGLLSHKIPQMSAYHLRNLESINLSSNKMIRLCPDVGMMHQLRHINLSDNCLTALPSALSSLSKLLVNIIYIYIYLYI